MRTGKKGIELIKRWEGYYTELPDGSCMAYLDKVASPPVWTIGWGCTEGVHKGLVWTKAQAEAKLLEEIAQTEREVAQVLQVELDQNQYDALISIGYNLKGGIRKAPTLMKHINNRDWEKAADAFMLYTGAGKKKVQGLVNRRADEVKLFKTWTPKEIKQESATLRIIRRIKNFLGGLGGAFVGADALGVGKEYVDWLKDFTSNYKYLFIAAGVGVVYGIYKYVEMKKIQEHEEGRYVPKEGE